MLRACIIAFVLSFACPLLAAAASPGQVAPGVHLLQGAFVEGQQPDGNSVLIETAQGIVVVDTGRHQAHTRRVLEHVAAQKKTLIAVINTHWHLDHTGGNLLIRESWPEAAVYASPALGDALEGFLAGYRSYLEKAIPEAQERPEEQKRLQAELALIQAGEKLGPTKAITASAVKSIGGKELAIHVESAVTAGDLWIQDPATKVLVAGDLVTLPVPFLDTACPSRWEAALGRLSEVDFETLIPGHGPAMSRADFSAYQKAFSALLRCAASEATKETCATGWIGDLGTLLPEDQHDFTRKLLDYYIDQHLRAEERTRQLCE